MEKGKERWRATMKGKKGTMSRCKVAGTEGK